jgi:Zn-dependent peptidase ImmA (M78 family)
MNKKDLETLRSDGGRRGPSETVKRARVGEKEARWRQIFNVAHELFHLISWSELLISQIQSNENLFHKNEKLADAFADALLMPQQMIDLDVRGNKLTYSFIVALASKYQVSKQAMLLRLRYLKFIPPKCTRSRGVGGSIKIFRGVYSSGHGRRTD